MRLLREGARKDCLRWFFAWICLAAATPLLGQPSVMLGEEVCGSLNNGSGVGPWDYNDPGIRQPTGEAPQTPLKLVENVHFRPEWEQWTLAQRKDRYGDYAYTLRAIPNHPRALNAVAKLERELGGKLPQGGGKPPHTAECWFDRAMRFRPNDGMVQFLYAFHSHALKRYEIAESAYLRAAELGVKSPQLNYNLGLLYVDMKQYDKAKEQAKIAYGGGIDLPGLRDRLTKAGVAP